MTLFWGIISGRSHKRDERGEAVYVQNFGPGEARVFPRNWPRDQKTWRPLCSEMVAEHKVTELAAAPPPTRCWRLIRGCDRVARRVSDWPLWVLMSCVLTLAVPLAGLVLLAVGVISGQLWLLSLLVAFPCVPVIFAATWRHFLNSERIRLPAAWRAVEWVQYVRCTTPPSGVLLLAGWLNVGLKPGERLMVDELVQGDYVLDPVLFVLDPDGQRHDYAIWKGDEIIAIATEDPEF